MLVPFEPEPIDPENIDFTADHELKRKRGRPKGSKTKPKEVKPDVVEPENKIKIENDWSVKIAKNRENSFMFLRDNPAFDEMPATIREFMGPGYLDIDPTMNANLPKGTGIRPGVKDALIDIFGDEIDTTEISKARRAMFTGAIGVGKTTLASVALAYMVHWVQCLHDPQAYFGLLPGSRIAFMLMSTKDSQAREVLFGDIKARINASPWFKKAGVMYDPKTKNQMIFPKDIFIIPGNSAETTFEGYNILAGVLDEGDSHKVTDNKDYAEAGYDTIHGRISSRFTNPKTDDHRGLLIVIGQMKKADGFMAKKKKQLETDDRAVVVSMTLWDSFGWSHYVSSKTGRVETFYFDIDRKIIVPPGPANLVKSDKIIKIPMTYFKNFENDPVKGLRDLAGIPPAVDDPFISAIHKVDIAFEMWKDRHENLYPYAVSSSLHRPEFHPEFFCRDSLKRALHIDIGYASDAMAMSMGHIPEVVEIDGELKAYVVIDFCLRMKPSGGQQLQLEDFRKIIYHLRDDLGFKIDIVTFDGFQSVDSVQLLKKKRFNAMELSVDRKKGPYEDLRETLYEERIAIPNYITYLNKGDTDKISIVKKELSELTDVGLKIDHPPNGSKDVSDSVAGVCHNLLRGNHFRRGSNIRHDRGRTDDADIFSGFGLSRESRKIEEFLSGRSDTKGNLVSPLERGVGGGSSLHVESDPFGRWLR